MKDALDAVQEFTYELDTNKNGKINSYTMKEMWDYENGMMGSAKRKETPIHHKKDPLYHRHPRL